METTEKQESQKTVVAFVAGLLIGGLLVWVFSSSPADAPKEEGADETETTETANTTNEEATTNETTTTTNTETSSETTVGGTVSIADQTAGTKVELGTLSFPAKTGWVAVRDESGILGAARFDIDGGLVPTAVNLLRPTVKGETYTVVFFNENGDKKFSSVTDTLISGVSDTLVAK